MHRTNTCIVLALAILVASDPWGLDGVALGQGSSQSSAQSQAEMDSLLAPIALYPDALIAQILLCAQSPDQVKRVDAWLKGNPQLKGSQAQAAAQQQGFDACFIALVPFPQTMDMLASQPAWTTSLGQAFTSNRNAVFDSIQRLRSEAQAAGNLQSTPQQTVVNQTTPSGQQVIVIQPANPQVVYVPQYNATTVYTQQSYSGGQVAGAAALGFAAGVIVGAAGNDGSYYYGWGYHGGGCCYSEGWSNYAQYRENMANDYYDHRQNMASQRGSEVAQNQSSRQSAVAQNESSRQDAASQYQSSRQDAAAQGEAARSSNQAQAESASAANQANRQAAATSAQGQSSSHWGGEAPPRGRTQPTGSEGGGASSRPEGQSSAFSGYQNGNSERAASSRGQQSMGGGGYRGGGGGYRGGGGRGR